AVDFALLSLGIVDTIEKACKRIKEPNIAKLRKTILIDSPLSQFLSLSLSLDLMGMDLWVAAG
ncbi:unnamed protein product, partial [Prunus brigantina]